MRLARLELVLIVLLGAALAVSVGMNLRQRRELSTARQESAAGQQALKYLREALRQREIPRTSSLPEAAARTGDERAALAQRDRTIADLNRQLIAARATIANLQAQLSQADDERQKELASVNERYQKEKDDWQNRLAGLEQQLDSTQADLKASRQQIADLEAANARLKSDAGQAVRAAEFSRALAQLEDLDRRRDAHLTSILSRYRDITSQFRAMSGMLDSARDPNSVAFTGAEVTRIQNAIALADDDLRRLSDLNAQARQLEKKLEQK